MDVYPRPQAIPSDSTFFKFPGAEVYVLMQRFVNAQCSAKSLLQHDAMTTWFSDWQVAHGRVSTLQIRVIVNNVKLALEELTYLEKCLTPVLNHVFDKATVEEWLGTYLDPLTKQLCDARERGDRVIEDCSTPKPSTNQDIIPNPEFYDSGPPYDGPVYY